jgi:hypothetical protein
VSPENLVVFSEKCPFSFLARIENVVLGAHYNIVIVVDRIGPASQKKASMLEFFLRRG